MRQTNQIAGNWRGRSHESGFQLSIFDVIPRKQATFPEKVERLSGDF